MFKLLKSLRFFVAFGLLAALPGAAKAGFDESIHSWWKDNYLNSNDLKPYLEPSTPPQHSQWRRKDWTVEDWAPNEDVGRNQVRSFFRADILREYDDGKFNVWGNMVPVLVVGEAFYHLSGHDQRRVVALFDHVTKATDLKTRMLYLKDHDTDKIIGAYSRSGLQLQ